MIRSMAVTLTDEEFDYIYDRMERLMDPVASSEEISDAIRSENEIWKKLGEVKRRESASEPRPSPEASPTS
jgi:hypothetical protein